MSVNDSTNGSCSRFLCSRKVVKVDAGQQQKCTSLLWRQLVVDQSQLSYSSPHDKMSVLAQSAMSSIRQHGHFKCPPFYPPFIKLIAHVMFKCPPFYPPKQLRAADVKLEMLLQGSWPLLRFLMIIGPSSFVPGQQGACTLQPLDFAHAEEQQVQAEMLLQHEQHKSSSSSRARSRGSIKAVAATC